MRLFDHNKHSLVLIDIHIAGISGEVVLKVLFIEDAFNAVRFIHYSEAAVLVFFEVSFKREYVIMGVPFSTVARNELFH